MGNAIVAFGYIIFYSFRKKQGPNKSEARPDETTGEDVEASQSETSTHAQKTEEVPAAANEKEEETFLPKSNISIGQKISNILARLKQTAEKKGEEKRLDETLAEEFERVRLNEGEREEEEEAGEKGERELKQGGEKEETIVIKESIGDRIRALFGKLKKPEDVEMVEKNVGEVAEAAGEAAGTENKEEEEEKKEKEGERKMEELEPEDKEEKEVVQGEGQRLGSETPV